MRSKAPLALMEQVCMLLVLAVAAVVCLQAFVWSDRTSAQCQAQDQALVYAQNAAELLKHTGDPAAAARQLGGKADGGVWVVPCHGGQTLYIIPHDSGIACLETAAVEVYDGDTRLVSLETAWQEVERDD